MLDIAIYVISLSCERFETIVGRLAEVGCMYPCIHIWGVKASTNDRDAASPACTLLCPDAKIGIWMAHQKVWATFLSSRYTYGVVLEDDVTFKDHFVQGVEQATALLADWDVVALGNMISGKLYSDIKTYEHVIHMACTHKGISRDSGTYEVQLLFGTHGYLVCQDSCTKLASLLRRVTGHIDAAITALIQTKKITMIGIRPSLVFQYDFASSSHSTSAASHLLPDEPPIDWMLFVQQWRILGRNVSSFDLISYSLVLAVFIGICRVWPKI